jgi:multiple sugar transport system substrate-binding protein
MSMNIKLQENPAMVWAARGLAALGVVAVLVLLCVSRADLIARATPPNPQHRIPVYYWHMWSGEWTPVMQHVVDDFNRSQTKYLVIPLQVPSGEGDTKFLLSVAGGHPPDVMAQWTQAISTWSEDGVLQPLDTRMTPAEQQYFMHKTFPVVHSNGWYKGHLYGIVLGMDVYACYYRPSQFRKAGLDPNHFPSTLEQLTADGYRLDKTNRSGQYTRLGFLPQTWTDFAPSFGGSFYDPATKQVLLGTPQNMRALNYIVKTRQRLGFNRVLRFNAGLKSQNGADWPFIDGSFSVDLDGEWRVKQLAEYAPHLDYRVAPLPPPRGGKSLASFSMLDFLTIPVGAKHPGGAWAFIKFWSGLDHPVQAAKFYTWFGWLPTSPQMANAPVYQTYLRQNPQYRTFVRLAASPNLVATPPVPDQLFLMDRIADADNLAESGTVTPQQAVQSLSRQMAREETRRKDLHYDQ